MNTQSVCRFDVGKQILKLWIFTLENQEINECLNGNRKTAAAATAAAIITFRIDVHAAKSQ